MTDEVRRWWEARAEDFQAELDLDVGVNWTGLGAGDLELLGDVDGKDVLELGCGGGQCSVAVALRGGNVVGIDLSAEQLSFARDLAADHDVDVQFLQADVTDLGAFPDERFDVAFNAWVFQWVGDLDSCFEEAHRVLRPDGRLVFSMPHPYYDVVDPDTHRVEDSYFDAGRQVTAHEGMDVDQVTYRHTVSDVHRALTEAGFRVERVLEPGSDDPEDYEAGPWGEYVLGLMSKVPSTLAFDARK